MKATDDGMNLVDTRQGLSAANGVQYAPMAATADHHQAEALDDIASGQLVLAIVGRLTGALLR